jgi:acetate kinase
MLVELGGLDALVFTAGIGEHRTELREKVCAGLEPFGVALDPDKNAACSGSEADVSRDDSPARILVIPANEEVVLAREVYRKVSG